MPIRNFINADTVDGFHASPTPSPNTIPVAGSNGKLVSGWFPDVGLNADTVDGFHASQTPSPNTIPVAGSDGKLNIGWLNASWTPVANAIPIADATGKIAEGWLAQTGFKNKVVFTTSNSWVVPSGITRIMVVAWGGGGGGGGWMPFTFQDYYDNDPYTYYTQTWYYGGEGGKAGENVIALCTVAPGETISVVIGAGGNGGGNSVDGGNGGSTIVSGSVSGTLVVASGGLGGRYGTATRTGQRGQTGKKTSGANSGAGGDGAAPNGSGGAGGSGYVEIWY